MVILNAHLIPVESQEIPCGFLRWEQGIIRELGPMEEYVPQPGEEQLDAGGKLLLPGLIDSHSHVGMWEDGLGLEGDDGNEECDPCTPHLRAIDAVNPYERGFETALRSGITTLVTGPGSANPIAGQMCALKTAGRCVDEMVVSHPLAIKMALGENPKMTYHEKDSGPITRMATAAVIREQLYKAKRYLSDLKRARENEDCDLPEYDIRCEALLPLLEHKIDAHIHAHRADDIMTAVRLAEEFDFSLVIVHGTEGYLIPDLLRESRITGVITGPVLSTRTKPELARAVYENSARLADAGILTTVCTDHPEVPVDMLAPSSLLAMEGDRRRALRAITIDAAKILHLEHRLGSLAPGKDADFTLWSGDPFAVGIRPEAVFLGGIHR